MNDMRIINEEALKEFQRICKDNKVSNEFIMKLIQEKIKEILEE